MPELTIPAESVGWLILKLRAFEGKVSPYEAGDEDDDSDVSGEALLNRPDDPDVREIAGFLRALDEDELIDLIALTWIGRGTYGIDEWDEARETAAAEKTTSTGRYLLGTPMAADYLAEGLAAFGFDPAELENDADEG